MFCGRLKGRYRLFQMQASSHGVQRTSNRWKSCLCLEAIVEARSPAQRGSTMIQHSNYNEHEPHVHETAWSFPNAVKCITLRLLLVVHIQWLMRYREACVFSLICRNSSEDSDHADQN